MLPSAASMTKSTQQEGKKPARAVDQRRKPAWDVRFRPASVMRHVQARQLAHDGLVFYSAIIQNDLKAVSAWDASRTSWSSGALFV